LYNLEGLTTIKATRSTFKVKEIKVEEVEERLGNYQNLEGRARLLCKFLDLQG
jgi:hypothetical protein